MAYDEALAQLLRDDLASLSGVVEKQMFGGVCFMVDGHMVCGVHKGGAMYRVGKTAQAQALAIPGAGPMAFTGRVMGGMVDVAPDAAADDDRRAQWLALALANSRSLPPKPG